ncbi:MAG TPA: DegT/DnrJ/EryC1/StrS family aminotransferase [Actinomycetota bacterium]
MRPHHANVDRILQDIRGSLEEGVLTNASLVRELERRAAEYLGVRHCIAVSSCTSGLMLALRAAGITGDVIVPSFTFAATAHAVAWNGLRPVFADIDPETLTISPRAVRRAVGIRTGAILGTHVYGTPCAVDELREIADHWGLRLLFDAAHAFGSRHDGTPVGGFGDAEVFSLSPTKVLVAAEGGIIATNDDALAERCRIGRDYGNPGDYDCLFVGLNARMSELHAAVALASLEGLDGRIDERNELAAAYRQALGDLSGVTFPTVPDGERSTYKDFTILVDPGAFGLHPSGLATALEAEGIDTRRYYAPPVHRMQAYRGLADTNGGLPATDLASDRVLTLPLWNGMTEKDVHRVADAVERIQRWVPDRSQVVDLPTEVPGS